MFTPADRNLKTSVVHPVQPNTQFQLTEHTSSRYLLVLSVRKHAGLPILKKPMRMVMPDHSRLVCSLTP